MSWISPLVFFRQKRSFLVEQIYYKRHHEGYSFEITFLKSEEHFFELIQIEVQCSKNHYKIFLPQEAGAYIYIYIYNFYREYFLCLQSNEMVVFCRRLLIL